MHIDRSRRRQVWVQNGLFVVLFLAAVGLLAYLSHSYQQQWDITQNTRNSLSEATINTLRQMPGALTITAYATAQDPRLGDVRKLIRDFLAPYQRAKSDLAVKFVDPSEQPQAARAAGVQINGEMVVEYGGRSEHPQCARNKVAAQKCQRLGE